MGADRRRISEKKVRRRSDRKESRRTADRRPRKGTASTALRGRQRRGEMMKTSTLRAPVSGGHAEGVGANETVVYGLVAYEDWGREERDELQQLLTGDLTDLRRAVEARAPGKPWTAVALGLACAAIAELRGSLR